jgi:DNA-binding CsgD family transcriptional regulator
MIAGPKALIDIKNTVWDEIAPLIERMGFDYGVYCFLDKNYTESYLAVTSENALEWGQYHIKMNYSEYDPVVHAGQGCKIFRWNSVVDETAILKKIMNERREYGMKSGVTVPLRNKANNLTGWLSLSCNKDDKFLETIINQKDFYENIRDVHIKSIAISLSKVSKVKYDICYAIILSEYLTNIDVISEKTGMAVQDLYRLFGHLYLYQSYISSLNIVLSENDIEPIVASLPKIYSKTLSISKRQMECIKIVAKGLTSKEGAKEMGISQRTYEEYLMDVRRKFNCSNQKELISKLYLEGIL